MNSQRFMTPQEKEVYRAGFSSGRQEGLRKASMLIALMAQDTREFSENILQNSKEAVELRKIFTEKGE